MSAIMTDTAMPLRAQGGLSARMETWLGHFIEIPAAVLVVGEVAVLLAGVVMRFVFNSPLPWADELASILFLWLANLGSAVALRRGMHMRTTALVSRWSETARSRAETLAVVIPILWLSILIWPMTEYAMDEWVVQTPALSWPNTVRAAAVPVGAAFMLVLCLFRLARHGIVEMLKVLAAIAVVAGALYFGADWLQAIGNWNLFIFFALLLGTGVLLGVPIAFCFGMATVAFLLTTTSTPLSVVAGRIDEGMSSLILLAVPLFILLGHLVEMTGMAKAMVDFLASLLGHVRGGLNYVLLGAMLLVSGISGAKTADMAAVAPVLLPEMKKRGNPEGELIALLAASGAMAETIPPSLVLITIGSVAGISISALFTGGIMPGVVLALILALLSRFRSAEIAKGLQRAPMTIVGKPGLEPADLKTLITYIRERPDKLNYAHSGLGSVAQLCGLMFMSATKTKMTVIPYKGGGEVMKDLLAGQIDVYCEPATGTTANIQAGKIKAYAVTTKKRVGTLPDVPTTTEAGFPEIGITTWYGLYAPKGTPAPVIAKLSTALQAAVVDSNVVTRFGPLSMVPVSPDQATPAALDAKLKSEVKYWSALLKEAGVKPE